MQRESHWPHVSTWLFYPEERHFGVFEAAGRRRVAGSAGRNYPGAVGAMDVKTREKSWTISYAQATFRIGDVPEINRSLASRYMGWRAHMFDAVFEKARQEGAEEIRLRCDPGHSNERLKEQEFAQAAKKHGFGKIEKQNPVSALDPLGEKYFVIARKAA